MCRYHRNKISRNVNDKIDFSSLVIDKENFTAIDKNGISANTSTVFDCNCIRCDKVFKANIPKKKRKNILGIVNHVQFLENGMKIMNIVIHI